jgi:hypothetical protein
VKDRREIEEERERRRKRRERNTAISVILIGLLCIMTLLAVGYCNVHAPCEVWRGSTIDQVPVRCIGELTR